MSLQDANFQDILSFYYEGTYAGQADEELERRIMAGDDPWLARMLRDYRVDPIIDPDEIAFRNCVDDWIEFCDVVEIAFASGLISREASRRWSWGRFARVLNNVHVRRYYEEFYPERLPQLLARRMKDHFGKVEGAGAQQMGLRFLEFDRIYVRNHRNGYLLKLLDDFTIKRTRFSDVTRLLETPQGLVDSVFKEEDEKQVVDRAVEELGLFFNFCAGLRGLLHEAREFPLLQAEIWSRYAYWFEIIADKMSRRLGGALEQFVNWRPEENVDAAVAEVQSYVGHAKETLQALFNAPYRELIDRILSDGGNDRQQPNQI